jgi:23S rRNA (guanine1835-N2)-methyltransferase
MNQVELAGLRLTLERYPPSQDANLQAWEAADEYLLQELASWLATSERATGPVLIFNDGFGALSCALHACNPVSISDSFLSQEATRRNLAANGLAPDAVTLLGSLDPLPQAPALVLIKIPKTLALLEQQLLTLSAVVTPETRILAGAKTRDIHNSTLALFEQILGPTRTSLAWKKSRLIHTQLAERGLLPTPYPTVWELAESGYRIHNHANVFSRGSLDIGARFFMDHLPTGLTGIIADLGCGNGVIGLTALAGNPEAQLLFLDESHMAIASSQLNVATNRPADLPRCQFLLGNSLEQVADGSLQAVLCNPPFHQQQTITDLLAWQMFTDAERCLASGGELWIIGNRHLGYHIKLQRLFSNVDCIATNPKFVILRAIKS